MNKKGFAISIILYSLVFLLITILFIILGILETRYNVTTNLRDSIVEDMNGGKSLYNKIAKLGDNVSITYVEKYNVANGAPIDTPDGSGNKAVYYYTSSTSANLAGQNGNVIFGNFCWQIVRTTTDGGVKLIYNGLKTNDDKCPNNASQRPSTVGFVGGDSGTTTSIDSSKLYGESFEIFNDNGTNKFRILHTNSYSWSDSTYQNIIGKFLCGTSSSPTGTSDTCEVLYFVNAYNSSTKAVVSKYTIGAPEHFSVIGKSPFNPSRYSPAFVGYMFNETYLKDSKKKYSTKTMLTRESVSQKYYYGDTATWNSSTNKYDVTLSGSAPTTSTSWADIRSHVQGMYTCKNTTDTSCAKVYYVVDNATDNYMYAVELSNNENINTKSMSLTYASSYSVSGNNYTLTNPTTIAILLKNWHSVFESYNGVYTCSDYTSTTCTKLYHLGPNSKHELNYSESNNNYIYGYSATYSNGSYIIDDNSDPTKYQQIWEWYKNYNNIKSSRYTCFKTNSNDCGNTIYYIFYLTNSAPHYLILQNGDMIEDVVEKMLNINNSSTSTINKYNSAVKAVIDSWYEYNLLELSDYLDMDAVYCNDRTVKSLGGLNPDNSSSDDSTYFTYYDKPSVSEAKLVCRNMTDRFSVNNNLAKLKYPIGLPSEPERALMQQEYIKTGKSFRLGSPYIFDNGTVIRIVNGSGSSIGAYSSGYYYTSGTYGIRPAITLIPGIEVSGGNGTYDKPYIINTSLINE